MPPASAATRYHCPKCSKSFLKSSGVQRHLKQLNSDCARAERSNRLVRPDELNSLTRDRLELLQAEDAIEVEKQVEADEGDVLKSMGDFGLSDDEHELENDGSSFSDEDARPYEGNDSATRRLVRDFYPGAAGYTFGQGPSFIDCFNADQFSEERMENLYYPFSSRKEWEIGSWLLCSGLSMASIDEFLSLEIIQCASLSFSSAKELRSRAELLPSGPKWRCKSLQVEYPTKAPVYLYYRDPIDCLRYLMRNPLYADVMEFVPYKLYRDTEKSIRVYSEWLSGDIAWQMQEKLPEGATLLGAVLSSDKTTISVMTGNRTAYPLILSLANIKKDYRLKNSHDTFTLLALLPVTKFLHKTSRIRGVLHDRLIHACLDLILGPLKAAATEGIMMTDPRGFQRHCFTTLASYTVDTPEAQLLACVGGKSSPVTIASYKRFGDSTRQETRTTSTTLAQLAVVKSNIASNSDFISIFKEASKFRLNGVLDPFWCNWFMAEPSIFLMPEPLHHWHKAFWDHDAKWCIAIVGAKLIDFMFSLLQPRIGYRQFREGISTLKQVTGRDHREIQQYIIPVIASIAPRGAVFAIRSLLDFRYLGQSPLPDSRTCEQMLKALNDFHNNKHYIMEAGGRVNKHGIPMNHWYITKLELLHNVVPSIAASGSSDQWTADITEHTHHTDIKVPARAGNNQNYDTQIVRTLDRMDKCRRFDLATSMKDANVSLRSWVVDDEEDEIEDRDEQLLVDNAEALATRTIPVSNTIFGTHRTLANYFAAAERLKDGTHNYQAPPPLPLRTFSSDSVAFHLARDPHLKTMSIDEASNLFMLPDIRHALNEFILHINAHGDTPCRLGGRRATNITPLSFDRVQIWTKMRIQTHSYHDEQELLPAETLNCLPPGTPTWPHGLYDSVLVNTDAHYRWPQNQLKGHSVAQLCLIFRPVPPKGSKFTPGLDGFLCYVQRFDIIPQSMLGPGPGGINRSGNNPDPITGMYALRRSLRADGSRQGGVIQVKHIRRPMHLVPRFRNDVDSRLTRENCMEYFTEFWLNDYFDKDLFYSFRLTSPED